MDLADLFFLLILCALVLTIVLVYVLPNCKCENGRPCTALRTCPTGCFPPCGAKAECVNDVCQSVCKPACKADEWCDASSECRPNIGKPPAPLKDVTYMCVPGLSECSDPTKKCVDNTCVDSQYRPLKCRCKYADGATRKGFLGHDGVTWDGVLRGIDPKTIGAYQCFCPDGKNVTEADLLVSDGYGWVLKTPIGTCTDGESIYFGCTATSTPFGTTNTCPIDI